MQRDFAYVVICTILAALLPSPAEGDDAGNGKADELFKFLQTLQENEPLYTIKRTYKENLRNDTGTKIQCVKANKMEANNTAAKLCTVVKSDGGTTGPFVATYEKTGGDKIRGEPGPHIMTVLYVNAGEKCFFVEMTGKRPSKSNSKACDMLSTNLEHPGSNCNNQFRSLCGSGSRTISTSDGCSGVRNPTCPPPK
uniref:Putative secreted protein n=1 Tax=Ixodes ricinus TaxID=34613 RepID=A0A090X9J6_IXORI